MRLSDRERFSFVAAFVVVLALLAVGCGNDDPGPPVYSGNSINLEEREGGPVVVYEIFITDGKGDT